tara:strand:+ start:1273 stop:1464 length:192 start_codon:yes stop_codon:yes gene_type:complete
MIITDEVIEAINHLSTLVREEMCDNNFEWTEEEMSMPDWIAHAYECCNIVDDFVRDEREESDV